MSSPPKAIRQIDYHHWDAGIDIFISNPNIRDQIVCWHESGWVYSMHLLDYTIDNSGNKKFKIRCDTYKLDVYPPQIGNILNYIISNESDVFKRASKIQTYIR